MSITINGTTGIAGVDGSASTPALQGADTNTGIAFPAADTVAISTGGSERMRVDSSGNVGIGTTSPTPTAGIATVMQNATQTSYRMYNGTNYFDLILSGNDAYVYNRNSAPLIFGTSNTERARITGAGEVYIAGTTDQGAYNLQCNGTGVWGAGAYVNGSDERIKDDIKPIASGLDVVNKLNPVTYRYKESWSKDQSVQTGFIAQELLTALDGQVYVDGVVQQGGSEGYYSVAYQNIIPILTKAIQELKAELDSAKARIATLEAK